ncbi:M24 family metallopeptidase [Candidatus Poriferisodalis sp.]|uniref:M24 family metallopeptidase n=1 Tax=Candidatus Poriferisodalis sp. TaxID=3101277 RepID=UPI003B01BAFF
MSRRGFEARHRPKIGTERAEPPQWLLDHTDLNMHALGPGADLEATWVAAGLELPNRSAMRRYRLERVREQLRGAGCDAALLYDPLNVRYATDTTNMSLWTMHNAVRYAFVAAEGPVVVFEFSDGEFLDAHSETVDEIRPGLSYIYFKAGPRSGETADRWAAEITGLVDEHGAGARRLAVDQLELRGIRALERRGVELVSAGELMEQARAIKGPDDIRAMRCAVHACETAVGEMAAVFEPGVSELDLWAELWAGSLRRYGEWIETRLLSSGPRTNPWYHEASSRRVQAGELMGFDTDLIGAYGMCVDLSRTWLCGGGSPNGAQSDAWSLALEQIQRNTELHCPGATLREITDKAWYPDPEHYRGYTVISHGVGLCDEYPAVYHRHKWDSTGYDGVLEPGMVMCVEAFIGPRSGGEGVKLEEQVLITETGNEVLTSLPLELV